MRLVRRSGPRDTARSRRFRGLAHERYWWHRLSGTDFVPPIYSVLSDAEWKVMESWYSETEERGMVGEINVPAMSLVQGLVSGGAVTRFVQLGHYCGYSTLLIGFWLRQMGEERRLVTVDIDPVASSFTEEWVQRAGLTRHVTVLTGAAADPELQARVLELVGGPPQMMLVDTSHGYEATKRELELWVPSLVRQGLLLVHGTSVFGQSFDAAGEGGVARAVDDWAAGRSDVAFLNLNRRVVAGEDAAQLVYRDGCGMGVLQRL
jgi:predicted O-methyltransferase YrrM